MMPDPAMTMSIFRGDDGDYIFCENCSCAILIELRSAIFTMSVNHKCRPGLVGNQVIKYVDEKDWF
jgi:hypothetical protein